MCLFFRQDGTPISQGLSLVSLDNHVDNSEKPLHYCAKPLICKGTRRIACFLGTLCQRLPMGTGPPAHYFIDSC